MKKQITFILPTRNRKAWVKRAIDSCLECESDLVEPIVIVLDGSSIDGSYEDLQNVYANDKRVLLSQEPKTVDFMTTCQIGVGLVKSELATFMYDDDVISPYFKDLVRVMLEKNHNFIMGYGRIHAVNSVYPFKALSEIREQNPCEVLLGHFGETASLKFPVLPVSPICCLVKTETLQKWVGILKEFTSVNSFRHYFLMKRNIGPDLIIYLSSLIKDLEEGQTTLVASTVVGQFSEHMTSMSIEYGSQHLTVGYWLSKIWAYEKLLQLNKVAEASKAGAYLIVFGTFVMLGQIRHGQFKWTGSQISEILGILVKAASYGILAKTLGQISALSLKKMRSGRNRQAAAWIHGQNE